VWAAASACVSVSSCQMCDLGHARCVLDRGTSVRNARPSYAWCWCMVSRMQLVLSAVRFKSELVMQYNNYKSSINYSYN